MNDNLDEMSKQSIISAFIKTCGDWRVALADKDYDKAERFVRVVDAIEGAYPQEAAMAREACR